MLKNASEAHANGPVTIDIATKNVSGGAGPLVQLSVLDNGTGIETELLERLFEPYDSSKPKGTGLGLAIVKKIVEEHNGIVWADNPTAGGARIVMQLPALVANENPQHQTDAAECK